MLIMFIKKNLFVPVFSQCSSRKYQHPPPHTEGSFASESPFQGVLGIPVIFQLGLIPSGKNICVKNVVARYYNFSWDKMKKYIFSFMLVWCLIISRTFFVNNQL